MSERGGRERDHDKEGDSSRVAEDLALGQRARQVQQRQSGAEQDKSILLVLRRHCHLPHVRARVLAEKSAYI